jgi:hypothetical protein
MHRIVTLVSRALVIASAAVVATASAEPPARPTGAAVTSAPGPEHARLTALCGTWDVEMTFWLQPGRPPILSKGVSTIRSLLDGLFIEEKIEGALAGNPFTTLAWTGFNTSTHQYEATRISSTNTGRVAETGAWDEQARRFELKASYAMGADTWTQRTVIQPTSATTMVATSYLSFGSVAEWKAVEIRYTLKAK